MELSWPKYVLSSMNKMFRWGRRAPFVAWIAYMAVIVAFLGVMVPSEVFSAGIDCEDSVDNDQDFSVDGDDRGCQPNDDDENPCYTDATCDRAFITVRYSAERELFRGRVGMSQGCTVGRRMVLREVRKGNDRTLGAAATDEDGHWVIPHTVSGFGRYRVTTKALGSADLTCARLRSESLALPHQLPPGEECGESGSQTDLAAEPSYSADYLHRFTNEDGCEVRLDVITKREGENACGGPSVADVVMGWPLGGTHSHRPYRIFVKDPNNVFGDDKTSEAYDPDATLPEDAIRTAYSIDGAAMWMRPWNSNFIYLVRSPDEVERWPHDPSPSGCG